MATLDRSQRSVEMSKLDRGSRIGFIGAGVVGSSLAVAFARARYSVVATSSRTYASAQTLAERIPGSRACTTAQDTADLADVVYITTPDDAIGPVASGIRWRRGQAAVHCSGAASLDVLTHAVDQGACAGGFHPIQAFTSVEAGVKSIPGITFGIEGGAEMRAYLSDIALAVGGNSISLEAEDKPLYHLSAVLMGNLLTVLAAVAAELWTGLGMRRADGVLALAPMIRQVSYNLVTSGVPGAVAGPYARGDIGTVRKHLEALHTRAPDVLPLYRELALAALPYALEKGTLGPDRADEIRDVIEQSRTEGR